LLARYIIRALRNNFLGRNCEKNVKAFSPTPLWNASGFILHCESFWMLTEQQIRWGVAFTSTHFPSHPKDSLTIHFLISFFGCFSVKCCMQLTSRQRQQQQQQKSFQIKRNSWQKKPKIPNTKPKPNQQNNTKLKGNLFTVNFSLGESFALRRLRSTIRNETN